MSKAMLYKTRQGMIGALQHNSIGGVIALNWEVDGVDHVLTVGNGVVQYFDGVSYEYSPPKESMPWGVDTSLQSMFLDSQNNAYIGFNGMAGTDAAYRLKAGNDPLLPGSWEDMSAATVATTRIIGFTEDDDGFVYFNEYAPNTNHRIWRVPNDGVSAAIKVVDGAYGGSGVEADDQIHNVDYDHHRKVLLSGHGDISGSYTQVADLSAHGEVWSTWDTSAGGLEQSTAFCFDRDYIYAASDLDGNRGIFRSSKITGTGVAAVLAATMTKVQSPGENRTITGVYGNDLTFTDSTITSDAGGTDLSVFSTSDTVTPFGSTDNDNVLTVHSSTAPTATVLTLDAPVTAEAQDYTRMIRLALENETGHCWFAHVDDNGWVMFSYGAISSVGVTGVLWVSENQGEPGSWRDIAHSSARTSGVNAKWFHRLATYSHLNTNWNGYWICNESRQDAADVTVESTPFMFRLIDGTKPILIDTVNGKSQMQADLTGVGLDAPLDFPFHTPPRYKFLTDYTPNYAPTMDGVLVDKNGVLVSAADSTALEASFVGSEAVPPSGFSEVGGGLTITANDTTEIATGAYSVTSTAANEYSALQRSVAATDLYLEQDCHAVPAIDDFVIFQRRWKAGSNNRVQLQANAEAELGVRWVNDADTNQGDGTFYFERLDGSRYTVPVDTTFNLRLRVVEALAGIIQVWYDGELVCDLRGINLALPAAFDRLYMGYSSIESTAGDFHWANGKVSEGDPDQPAALALRGSRQKLIPDVIVS